MKTLMAVTTAVVALAAVPAALADNGIGSGAAAGLHGNGNGAARIQRIQDRLARVELRFARRCGTSASNAPQRCVDFAQKALQRLQTLDDKVQQAEADHPQLQQLDTLLQGVIGKLQTWLGASG
jgi:hypothetical protein